MKTTKCPTWFSCNKLGDLCPQFAELILQCCGAFHGRHSRLSQTLHALAGWSKVGHRGVPVQHQERCRSPLVSQRTCVAPDKWGDKHTQQIMMSWWTSDACRRIANSWSQLDMHMSCIISKEARGLPSSEDLADAFRASHTVLLHRFPLHQLQARQCRPGWGPWDHPRVAEGGDLGVPIGGKHRDWLNAGQQLQ